jgi:hypothetical protein
MKFEDVKLKESCIGRIDFEESKIETLSFRPVECNIEVVFELV